MAGGKDGSVPSSGGSDMGMDWGGVAQGAGSAIGGILNYDLGLKQLKETRKARKQQYEMFKKNFAMQTADMNNKIGVYNSGIAALGGSRGRGAYLNNSYDAIGGANTTLGYNPNYGQPATAGSAAAAQAAQQLQPQQPATPQQQQNLQTQYQTQPQRLSALG